MQQRKRKTALNWARLGTTKQERARVQQERKAAAKDRERRSQHGHLQATLPKKDNQRRAKKLKL